MHIAVCIITYKRPAWLKRLLLALQRQVTDDLFTFSAVIVDNDRNQSARAVVEEVQKDSSIPINYFLETKQNLAMARNMAIQNATGDFIAFIDDDEFPVDDWLLNLFRTWRAFRVSAVLGPVVPHFEQTPPKWIVRSKIFNRSRHQTGQELTWRQTRTGNVLLERKIFQSPADMFEVRFAMHGEDLDLFKRLSANGHRFVWCDEAEAFETQAPARLRRRYHMRRGLLRGSVFYTHVKRKIPSVLKSVVALLLYLPALLILHLFGHHWFMIYTIKCCDHIGRLLAFCGYRVEEHIRQP